MNNYKAVFIAIRFVGGPPPGCPTVGNSEEKNVFVQAINQDEALGKAYVQLQKFYQQQGLWVTIALRGIIQTRQATIGVF